MKVCVWIDHVSVDIDDESKTTTLDGVESLLSRAVDAAVRAFNETSDLDTEDDEDNDSD